MDTRQGLPIHENTVFRYGALYDLGQVKLLDGGLFSSPQRVLAQYAGIWRFDDYAWLGHPAYLARVFVHERSDGMNHYALPLDRMHVWWSDGEDEPSYPVLNVSDKGVVYNPHNLAAVRKILSLADKVRSSGSITAVSARVV